MKKEDRQICFWLMCFIIICVAAHFTFKAQAEEPKVPEPEVEKVDPPKELRGNPDHQPELDIKHLTEDEIIFVKAQFREAILISAANAVVICQYDHWGNPATVHPEKNPVVILLCKTIFKHYKDMESQIFDEVYNARTATGPAKPQEEAMYIKKLLQDKVNKDDKFWFELVKASKESLKHTYKEWVELSKNDK